MDKYDLYELCVQNPALLAPLLRAIHAAPDPGQQLILGEDFCGSAALSRQWIRLGGLAVGVDADPEPLAHARRFLADSQTPDGALRLIHADVMDARDHADVIFVGNFSIGEIHIRQALVRYLAHARSRLRDHGVFVCDTYGGESAFLTGSVERDHHADTGRRVKYRWEQRDADPLTGMVTNALHFRVFNNRELELDLPDAFTYRWRLWSVPELRDAMLEVGFAQTEVYASLPDAVDADGGAYIHPVDPADLDESFIVCVAARV